MYDINLVYVAMLIAASILAGIIGALCGLGGGVLIVPFLTLYFRVPVPFAIGASIVATIATSSGSAAGYVRDGISNIKVGTFLVIFTATGAIMGAYMEHMVPGRIIMVIFGAVLLVTLIPVLTRKKQLLKPSAVSDHISEKLSLNCSYFDESENREVKYNVTGVKAGSGMLFGAGVVSGLLGIGAGAFNFLAMDLAMKLPTKVCTTTSNFMIGVTAAASAAIYFFAGDVDPFIVGPVAVGVAIGAIAGARILKRVKSSSIRKVFAVIILFVGVEMLLKGFGVSM